MLKDVSTVYIFVNYVNTRTFQPNFHVVTDRSSATGGVNGLRTSYYSLQWGSRPVGNSTSDKGFSGVTKVFSSGVYRRKRCLDWAAKGGTSSS